MAREAMMTTNVRQDPVCATAARVGGPLACSAETAGAHVVTIGVSHAPLRTPGGTWVETVTAHLLVADPKEASHLAEALGLPPAQTDPSDGLEWSAWRADASDVCPVLVVVSSRPCRSDQDGAR